MSKKKICGVGINNADYVVAPKINGVQAMCCFYKTWRSMIRRCYSGKSLLSSSSYSEISVSPEWLKFLTFKAWMVAQNWRGMELDKDVMYPGNKIYGPDTCVFVSSKVNKLLNCNRAARGLLPIGVSYHKRIGRYEANISKYGKSFHLGYYDTPEVAAEVYQESKRLYILSVACCEPDIRVKHGLYRHSELLRSI